MRILVAGAQGFMGRAVMAALGPDAVGVDKSTGTDLTDIAQVRQLVAEHRPTHIIYAAGGLGKGPSADNFLGPQILGHFWDALEAAQNPVHWVQVSSSGVYGRQDPSVEKWITVDRPPAPRSAYAVAKLAEESLLGAAQRRGLLTPVIMRVFNPIGPGQRGPLLVPSVRQRILAAREKGQSQLTLGAGHAVRDFIDVRDVAQGLVVGLTAPAGTYHLCRGQGVTVLALVERLIAALGGGLTVVPEPMPEPEIPYQVGDPSLTHNLGWTPQYSLEATVQAIAER